MKSRLIVLAVIAIILTGAVIGQACSNQVCQLVRCANGQNGWVLITWTGWQDTLGTKNAQHCALACFPQQCSGASLSAIAEVSCGNDESIGAIAFVDPDGTDAILFIKNIKLKNFESYTEQLERLSATVPFDELAHAVKTSDLPFANKEIVVYANYEAYTKELPGLLQGIYAQALWEGTHKQKNGN